MTAPECATGCTRPALNGHLCKECTGSLRATLQLAATLEADLNDAAARLLRHGGGVAGAQPAEQPLPVDLRASAAARRVNVALALAIGMTLSARAWSCTDHTMTGMARWLLMYVGELAQHPRSGDACHEIGDAVARAVAVLEGPPELHPAGDCECGAPLLADARADEARCRKCGAVVTGIEASRRARAASADVLGDSEAISRALAGLGVRVSGGTIRMWVTRKRLIVRPDGAIPMSDVLALVAERDERKSRA